MFARKRLTMLLAAGAIGVAATATAAPAQAAGAAVASADGTQELAALQQSTTVFAAPNSRSQTSEKVSEVRPITHHTTVLPVLAQTTDPSGVGWLRVLLPGRPNGHSGWIERSSTKPASTDWRVTVDLSARRVTTFRDGHRERRFRAVVGKPSTPTPTGRFFVEETLRLGKHAIGAPLALALSARSRVLKQFEGGPGQIALHGTNNVGGTLGTAASHGCVRLHTSAITWLAAHIDAGTMVTIQR
jgi:lipoprotein-anchoring transpeptidase ErfK/SrfK